MKITIDIDCTPAEARKNLSSARHYDQIRFRFHTAKTRRRRSGIPLGRPLAPPFGGLEPWENPTILAGRRKTAAACGIQSWG